MAEAKKKKYPNGDVYEGEWKGGKPDGKGKMTYVNGAIYEGDWKKGQPEGKGKMVYVSGDIYEGEWKEGKHNGKGKITYANGGVYEGKWKNGKDSHGKMVYTNGDIYEGEWENNQPNGQGKMIYTNGNIYEGDWVKGESHGKGKMIYANGNIYEGEWFMGKFFGIGKMIYPNGEIFEGEWKNDKPEGKGQITYANGNKYEWEWENGKIRLFLRSNINNISEFFGVKKDNETMSGEVKYSYANNNCSYTGDLRDYKRHGEGTFCFTPENCISGIWKSDSLVSGSGDFVVSRISVHITKKINQPFYFILNLSGNDESKYRKTIQLNKEFPIDQLYNIAFSEIEKFKKNPDIAQLIHETEEKERWEKGTNFNIILEKPNTILSHIPLNRLDQIDSLTITGFLYEADVAVINKCRSLRYLDLSRAFITYSPQAKQQLVNEQQGAIAMAQLLGIVADLSDKELSKTDYIMMKTIAKLGNLADEHKDKAEQIKQANKDCIIPESAFEGMTFLKTVKLPITAIAIKERAFYRCKGLEYVELPPYLKSISKEAFSSCKSLKNLDFPTTITEIEDGAFSGCDSIKKVDLSKNKLSCRDESLYGGNNMEVRLHYNAVSYFCYNKNCTIYFPASLEQIGGKITNCELHFSSPIPPKFRNEIMFGYILQDNKIYVPKGSMTAYFVALGEKNTYIEE